MASISQPPPDHGLQDNNGRTAMHHAAEYHGVDVLELLLDGGGDVNVRGRVRAPPPSYRQRGLQ